MVKRAFAAGYTAVVFSGDRPVLGRREADVRNYYELDQRLNIGKVFSTTGARIGPRENGSYDLVGAGTVDTVFDSCVSLVLCTSRDWQLDSRTGYRAY